MVMCNSRIFALVWRILGFLIANLGIIFLLCTPQTPQIWAYFAVQLDFFAALLFLILLVKTSIQIKHEGKEGAAASIYQPLQAGLVFMSVFAMIFFWTMLSWSSFAVSTSEPTILTQIGSYIIHGIAPIWLFVDYILFMPHGNIGYRASAWWLLYPFAYTAFVLVRALILGELASGSRFPYFFMNIDSLGWLCLPIAIGIFVLFYALGLFFIYIDKTLAISARARRIRKLSQE